MAAITTVCQAKNAVYQGTTKIESWGWKEIYEVLKLCASSGFATAPDGLIPKCLWDVPIAPPLAYYQADPAFVAGFIDGAYSTIGQLFSSAVSILDIATCYTPNVGVFNPSPKCIEIMTKTFETFDMIRELVNNKTVRDQAWVQIKKQAGEYIDATVCLQNSCRYQQGKIAFEVASMFVGIGELKAGLQAAKFTKLLKAVDNISDQIKVIHRAIHGLGGKFVKSTTSTAKGVVDVLSATGTKIAKVTNGLIEPLAQYITTDPSKKVVRRLNGVKYKLPNSTQEVTGDIELVDGGGCEGLRLNAETQVAACNLLWRISQNLTQFSMATFRALPGVRMTGRTVNMSTAYSFLPSNPQLQSWVTKIVNNGDIGGNYTEAISQHIFQTSGYRSFTYLSKVGSNNGIDGLFIKTKSGQLLDLTNPTKSIDDLIDEIDEVIISESKQLNGAGIRVNRGNKNSGLPQQMTPEWVKNVAGRMINSGNSNGKPQQVKLGQLLNEMIDNHKSKVVPSVTAVNTETAEILVQKINPW